MPPAKKPLEVELPATIKQEIEEAARRTHRSVAFIVRRALAAAKGTGEAPAGERVAFALATDEEDAPDTIAKIQAAGGGQRPLGNVVAGAWMATREKFQTWIARAQEADAAAQSDDLDASLADAKDGKTAPDRLAALARSEYPRVRALVAAHGSTPAEALAALARDKDRTVREAAKANPRTPAS